MLKKSPSTLWIRFKLIGPRWLPMYRVGGGTHRAAQEDISSRATDAQDCNSDFRTLVMILFIALPSEVAYKRFEWIGPHQRAYAILKR